MLPHEVSCGETCARSVRRPTARYDHVVARNLQTRIVAYEATTYRDHDEFPQSLHLVTAENTTCSGKSLDVVTYLQM